MKIKKLLIIFPLFFLPIICFAPDNHSVIDPFNLMDIMRNEVIRADKQQYQANYKSFKKDLAHLESTDDWRKYNPYGFIGKYQFGKAALEATGYGKVDFIDFIDNPAIFGESEQEKAMDRLLRMNEQILASYFREFVGHQVLDSITVTRMGLLAAAHLAGPGNVKRFLETKGKFNPRDRMGTRLSDYLFNFSSID